MLIYSLMSFQAVHICSVHSSYSDIHSAMQKQRRSSNRQAFQEYGLHGQKHGVVSTADLLLACNTCHLRCHAVADCCVGEFASHHARAPQIPTSMLAMHADSILKPSTLTRATMGAVYFMHTESWKSATKTCTALSVKEDC